MTRRKRALIVHPFKAYSDDLYNCLSQEMLALCKLLMLSNWHIQLCNKLDNFGYQLRGKDAVIIWGCGEGKSQFWHELESYTGQIYWLVGDPDYSVIYQSNMPADQFQNEVVALSAIKGYNGLAHELTKARTDCWMPSEHIYVPLWEYQFGEQVARNGKYIHVNPNYTHLLGYIGHKRSDYRSQRLEHYLDTNLYGSYSVSFETKCARHDCFPRCDANKVTQMMRCAVGTLVVGDPLYNWLNPTPQRLLQAWANGVLGFIDGHLFSYDIIAEHYPKLSWLYVSEPSDISTVFELSKMDWNALLAAQYEYLYYLHKEASKFSLIVRT